MISQEQLDQLLNAADPKTSEQRLRAADTNRFAPRADRDELATQVARMLGLQSRFSEALAMLDGITGTEPQVRVRVLLERGRVLNSSGSGTAAEPLLEEAARLAQAHGLLFLALDALHMLAIVDQSKAELWTRRALDLLAGVTDERTSRWAIALHNNLGWTLQDDGDYPGALAEFESALAAARRWGTPGQQEAALDAVSQCRRSLGRADAAGPDAGPGGP